MRKIFALFLTSALLLGFSSCGDDSVLSASSAKKALKKEAIFADDFATVKFNTGYYEIDESDMVKLLQLKAAGMITLTTENVIEKVTKRNYSYWSGYSYYTVDKEHTFANVQLTEEGKKLEIEEPTSQREDVIKDFKANKDYVETIPDYMTNYGSVQTSQAEVTEEVAVEEVVELDSAVVVEEVAQPEPEPAPAPDATKKDPNAAYNAALAKVNTQSHNMLLGRYKLEKVKEVLCSEDMAKNGTGKCLALVTFQNKTPFGYVYNAPEQDYISTIHVNFVYYQDLGWTVSNFDK